MRVAFVVDGFNLYHSIREAQKAIAARPLKWLDVRALCRTYTRSSFGPKASLESVHYFSALARHLEASDPSIVQRHETYIEALRSTGVDVTLANFKRKDHYLSLDHCTFRFWPFRAFRRFPLLRGAVSFRKHEEKETDVAVATKMFELLHTQACDAVVLVSGDTDLLPAIRTARRLFPGNQVAVLFPFKRFNVDLQRSVARSFKIKADQYARHQFPDPILLPDGSEIRKPASW